MRRLGLFLKTTTLGGLLVLLPVVLTGFLLSKALGAARVAAAKMISLVTGQPSETVQFPMILAVLLVLAISFVLGLLLNLRIGARSERWVERVILFRVPGYAAVKNIINGLANTEREGMVKAALVSVADGVNVLAFVMEDHGDGRLTIFIPSSPSAASGSVQIVHQDRVKMLNVRLPSVVTMLNQWGVGAQRLLRKHLERDKLSES
jgi:uncharacterized membrane protein